MAKRKPRSWLDHLVGDAAQPAERTRERDPLTPVYVLLGLVVVLGIVIWYGQEDRSLSDLLGPNLASESLGILLTLVFVRGFLEQHERSRRLRASVGALRKARRALQDVVDTWTTTMKGCMLDRQRGQWSRVEDLLSPDNSDLLLWCDPAVRRAGGTGERWVSWAGKHLRDLQASLDQIVGTYGGTLDPEYVEALDNLIADPFLRGIADLTEDQTLEAARWRVALNNVRALRLAHFERLLITIKAHNDLVAETATVRGRAAVPRTSMLGVELPPDYDLKIDTALDEGWWKSSPTVGSLRMPEPRRQLT